MNLYYKAYFYLVEKITNQQKERMPELKKKITSKVNESGVIKKGIALIMPSYKKFFYCDKISGEGWFFRLKPSKSSEKRPVIIYNHGHGLNRASKNDVHMYEFYPLRKNLNQADCHQVAMHTDFSCDYNTDEYSRALDGVVDYIDKTYHNVDFNRIYLIGTSHGGYACVYEVLRNPDKFAGVVIAMSYTYNEVTVQSDETKARLAEIQKTNKYYRVLTDEDYKTLSKTPFYLAWAKNDTNNMVRSNELLYENLEKNGGKVKTKIYDDGGHTIYSPFFKSDLWCDWLFGQERL